MRGDRVPASINDVGERVVFRETETEERLVSGVSRFGESYAAEWMSEAPVEAVMLRGRVRDTPIIQTMLTKRPAGMK